MSHEHSLQAPQALIDYFEREQETSFWGQKCTIKPAVVRDVLGDGGKLAFVTPLMTRPNYYAILVHSSWTEDDLAERSEELLQTIEESFGNYHDKVDEADVNADEDSHPWPALHDGGHTYGFIDDVPVDVLQAAQDDLARQMREQRALFIEDVRVKPGTLLVHPEFGVVQARLNDALGWHYCRRNTQHEVRPGQVGYGTDFSGVTVHMQAGGPAWDNTGIYKTMSTPTNVVTAATKRKTRPR